MKKYVTKLLLLVFLFTSFTAAAQETSEKGLYHYVLDNGLELFVMENHAAPLAYIEIAIRAGGISQSEKNAGLFHLYEHMMFKGNTKYKTAAAVQRALKNLGVASWNGSTANEFINYFFTVPSSSLTEGLEFWSHAVRDPLLDPNELENEKKVVISEISAYHSNPNWILNSAVFSTIFSDEPWKLDPGGNNDIVASATVEDLVNIKNSFYIPNNAALFVGGDVNPDDVFKKVKKIYGSWEKGIDPWEHDTTVNSTIDKTIYLVQPHPQVSPQIAQVMAYYRGPDITRDKESTYAADMWSAFVNAPAGRFEQSLIANPSFAIPNADYLSTGYLTSRHHSIIQFTAIMLSPEQMIGQRAAYFAQVLSDEIALQIVEEPDFFSESDYKDHPIGPRDSQILRAQRPESYMQNIRYWWAVADTEYYFTHDKLTDSMTQKEISQFSSSYLLKKPAVVVVLINPDLYAQQKSDYDALGYKEITSDSAFWWK